MDKKKLAIMFLVLGVLTVNTAAQTDFQGSQNPLGDIFQEINNQIDWYEGTGIGSFLLWIVVPTLGMYAIFRFIYAKAFGFAEENFRENSGTNIGGSADNLSDMADSMSKLLAASTSIIALVFWGGLLGWAMVIAGIAGIAWFAWANAAGFAGTTSPLPFGNGIPGSSDGGGSGMDPEEVDEAIQEGMEETKSDIMSEIEDLETESQTVEGQLREIMSQEEKFEQKKAQIREIVESGKLTSSEAKRLEVIIEETEDVAEMEERIENYIENVLKGEKQIEKLEEQVADAEDKIAQLEADIQRKIREVVNGELNDLEARVEQFHSQIEELEGQIEEGRTDELEDEIKQLRRELQEEYEEVEDIIRKLNSLEEELEGVSSRLEEVEGEDEELREELESIFARLSEIEDKVRSEEGEIKDEEEKTKSMTGELPENWYNWLKEAEEEEETVAGEEEEETGKEEDIAGEEQEMYKWEEEALEKFATIFSDQQSTVERAEQRAFQIREDISEQMEWLEQATEESATEIKEEAELEQIHDRLEAVLEDVRQKDIYALEDGVMGEIARDIQELREIENAPHGEKQEKEVKQAMLTANQIIELIRKDVLNDLNTVEEEAANAQNPGEFNQAYSDFQKIMRVIGDRDKIPEDVLEDEGPNGVSILTAEREIMDVFKDRQSEFNTTVDRF